MTDNPNKKRPPAAENKNLVNVRNDGAVQRRTRVTVREKKLTRLVGQVDRPFLILVVILVCIGSVMVFSTSYTYAELKGQDSFYYARRQFYYVLFGMAAMAVVSKLGDYRWLKRFTFTIFIVALAINVATAIPGIGLERNGARRWLNIGIDFQPSEVLKFALILMCAKQASDSSGEMNNFKKGILPFLMILGMCAVPVILQKHLSCTIIITVIAFAMMWMGGSPAKWLVGSALAGVAGIAAVLNSEKMSHSIARIAVWRDPFAALSGDGWQPAQSLYAISAGGFWGLGLGQSNQKHGYLPEPHNDYIFAILCEELGYFGAIVVIALFVALIWRGIIIAKKALNMYSALIVSGIMCSLAVHVLLNIAVVTNSIPSTGIGLPFFSYGGTSLCIWLAEMGVVLCVSRYSYLKQE
ncbi:MAG: putative lipid II flippase FtsW [Clostridia bacterium]|nr:putative lipid II flippase FtsW [Clostridia bacterium]